MLTLIEIVDLIRFTNINKSFFDIWTKSKSDEDLKLFARFCAADISRFARSRTGNMCEHIEYRMEGHNGGVSYCDCSDPIEGVVVEFGMAMSQRSIYVLSTLYRFMSYTIPPSCTDAYCYMYARRENSISLPSFNLKLRDFVTMTMLKIPETSHGFDHVDTGRDCVFIKSYEDVIFNDVSRSKRQFMPDKVLIEKLVTMPYNYVCGRMNILDNCSFLISDVYIIDNYHITSSKRRVRTLRYLNSFFNFGISKLIRENIIFTFDPKTPDVRYKIFITEAFKVIESVDIVCHDKIVRRIDGRKLVGSMQSLCYKNGVYKALLIEITSAFQNFTCDRYLIIPMKILVSL